MFRKGKKRLDDWDEAEKQRIKEERQLTDVKVQIHANVLAVELQLQQFPSSVTDLLGVRDAMARVRQHCRAASDYAKYDDIPRAHAAQECAAAALKDIIMIVKRQLPKLPPPKPAAQRPARARPPARGAARASSSVPAGRSTKRAPSRRPSGFDVTSSSVVRDGGCDWGHDHGHHDC